MEDGKRRGISLSPKTMVDNVSDWPLHRVVEHLRKKEKEKQDPVAQSSRVHCRSTVKSLVDVIESIASNYGVPRNRMCRWLSYHGIAIARDDIVISKLAQAQTIIRNTCLLSDDTDSLDVMNSLTPYAPKIIDEAHIHIPVYDIWVDSDFDDMARVCGVFKYRIVQIYLIKSILSDDVDKFQSTANRLMSELARWDTWMDFRLCALEGLVKNITKENNKEKGKEKGK